jgi:hypothetical protein
VDQLKIQTTLVIRRQNAVTTNGSGVHSSRRIGSSIQLSRIAVECSTKLCQLSWQQRRRDELLQLD